MSAAIMQAAISYFGLPEGTQLVEGGPVGAFAFVIPLTEEHLRGIADRMKALAEPVAEPYEQTVESRLSVPNREQLRGMWNVLPPAQQGRFGSFGRYVGYWATGAMPSEGIGGREVQHIDAPVDEAQSALPDAVWVPYHELSDQQRILSSDSRQMGGWLHSLIQVAMLTDEQRAEYAPKCE